MIKQKTPSTLVCGSCDYPVRGISRLNCPECGADLTEVGITKGSKIRAGLIHTAIVIGYTATVVAITFLAFRLMIPVLPIYAESYYSIQIQPLSGEYEQLGLHIDADLIQPASKSPTTSMIVSPSSGPMTAITLYDPGTKVAVTDINIFFLSKEINGTPITPGTAIGIDPITQQATWVDAQGKRFTTSSAFTDQDLLACFAAHGVDIARPDVQGEAKQLHAFFTDVMQGKHQLTLNAFASYAYGGGRGPSHGPPWFQPTLIAAAIVIWLIGLILILMRGRKRA